MLTGDKYNGLGIRPAREFDLVAVHSNSEQTFEPQSIEPNLSRARWSAVALNGPSRQATVALYGDPGQCARRDSVFYDE